MAVILRMDEGSKSFGEKPLLDGTSLVLHQGERVALIGDNGTGKSTLLRIITADVELDQGSMTVTPDATVGMFEQVPVLPEDATVTEVLEAVMEPLRRDIARYEELAANMDPRAEGLMSRIERAGGWEWGHRIEEARQRVGLDKPDARVGTLSGGYRRRLALARLLLGRPDLILLDEPTNHLDTDTIEWMEAWLAAYEGTLLLVTHDRYFLDRVATAIVELRGGKLRRYDGNYADYLEARAEEDATRERTLQRRARLLATELEWARRQPKARGGKSKARLQRIDDAEEEQRVGRQRAARPDFRLTARPKKGGMVLEVEDLEFAFEGHEPLIQGLSFGLERGDRVGLVGPNGTGKTTLLRLLQGELEPTGGRIRRGGRTDIAYFDQERSHLDPEDTVRGCVLPQGGEFVTFGGAKLHVLSWLKRFGFSAEAQDRKVGRLSGGERNRLAMARFLLEEANLVLLDEPTNDLDLFTISVLEEALLEFKGCVLVVSHDRYFLDRIATGILGYEPSSKTPGHVAFVKGDYSTYRALRMENEAAEEAATKPAKKKAQSKEPKVQEGPKPLTYGEKMELEEIPAKIEAAEADVARLQEKLADPTLWQGDQSEAMALQQQATEKQGTLAELYARWEALEERA